MGMLRILSYPDPALRAPNLPLAWNDEAKAKVEEMYKLLGEAEGLGLAAPQVAWNVRLFIMDVPDRKTGDTASRVVFNPSVIPMEPLVPMEEGCLSLPRIYVKVPRSPRVRLVGETPEGTIDEILTDLDAQAAQHEMDHLNGILLVDKMSAADRMKWKSVLEALEKEFSK